MLIITAVSYAQESFGFLKTSTSRKKIEEMKQPQWSRYRNEAKLVENGE